MYTENPQEKGDLTEATSKEQEGESTSTASDPVLSLVSPNLRVICSLLLYKYPKTMKDTSKWTLSLKGFLLQQFKSSISQLQSKVKKECLALPLDNFLCTLSEAESLNVNVGWLMSRITALWDFKKAGPFVHNSLSSLCEYRVKENSCINKAKEAKLALQVHATSIT